MTYAVAVLTATDEVIVVLETADKAEALDRVACIESTDRSAVLMEMHAAEEVHVRNGAGVLIGYAAPEFGGWIVNDADCPLYTLVDSRDAAVVAIARS